MIEEMKRDGRGDRGMVEEMKRNGRGDEEG
jgi:hypothetical protein